MSDYPVAIVALSEDWRSWSVGFEGMPTKRLSPNQTKWMRYSPKVLQITPDTVIEYVQVFSTGYLRVRNIFVNSINIEEN